MRNGSETHGKGGKKEGPAKAIGEKTQKSDAQAQKKGNKGDLFKKGK